MPLDHLFFLDPVPFSRRPPSVVDFSPCHKYATNPPREQRLPFLRARARTRLNASRNAICILYWIKRFLSFLCKQRLLKRGQFVQSGNHRHKNSWIIESNWIRGLNQHICLLQISSPGSSWTRPPWGTASRPPHPRRTAKTKANHQLRLYHFVSGANPRLYAFVRGPLIEEKGFL